METIRPKILVAPLNWGLGHATRCIPIIEALIEKGIDSIKGARGLSQVRREGIENLIADTLISSPMPKGTTFHIGFENNSFKFEIEKPQKKLDVIK